MFLNDGPDSFIPPRPLPHNHVLIHDDTYINGVNVPFSAPQRSRIIPESVDGKEMGNAIKFTNRFPDLIPTNAHLCSIQHAFNCLEGGTKEQRDPDDRQRYINSTPPSAYSGDLRKPTKFCDSETFWSPDNSMHLILRSETVTHTKTGTYEGAIPMSDFPRYAHVFKVAVFVLSYYSRLVRNPGCNLFHDIVNLFDAEMERRCRREGTPLEPGMYLNWRNVASANSNPANLNPSQTTLDGRLNVSTGMAIDEEVRGGEERRLERSDSKSSIPPSCITKNLILVASLIAAPSSVTAPYSHPSIHSGHNEVLRRIFPAPKSRSPLSCRR